MTKEEIEQREAEIVASAKDSHFKKGEFQQVLLELNALMWAKVAITLAERRQNEDRSRV